MAYDEILGYDPEKLGEYAAAYNSGAAAINSFAGLSITDLNNIIDAANREAALADSRAYNAYLQSLKPGESWTETGRANLYGAYNAALNQNKSNLQNYINSVDVQKKNILAQSDVQKSNLLSDYITKYIDYKNYKAKDDYNKAIDIANASGNYSGMGAYGWTKQQIKKANYNAAPKVTRKAEQKVSKNNTYNDKIQRDKNGKPLSPVYDYSYYGEITSAEEQNEVAKYIAAMEEVARQGDDPDVFIDSLGLSAKEANMIKEIYLYGKG